MVDASHLQVVPGVFSATTCRDLVAALDALPLNFEAGRQGTGYDKACLREHVDGVVGEALGALQALLGRPPGFDAWWLVYPVGSHIPAHVDPTPADGLAHVRVNVVVEVAEGGAFVAACNPVPLGVGDAVVFRPDVVEHAVTMVRNRPRRVLSVGTLMTIDDADVCIAAAPGVSAALRR